KGSALAQFTSNEDGGLVATNNTGNRRETKAASSKLCREERIEYFGLRTLVHSRTGIVHLQTDVFARRETLCVRMEPPVSRIYGLNTRPDCDDAFAVPDCFGGIQNQIHENLLNLPTIGFNEREFFAQVQMQDDFLGSGGPHEFDHFGKDNRQIQPLHQ